MKIHAGTVKGMVSGAGLVVVWMGGMGAVPTLPKHSRPSEFDAGQVQEKPKSKEKGSLKSNKGRSSIIKAKGKAPAYPETQMEVSVAPQELEVFLFSIGTSGDGKLSVVSEDVKVKKMKHPEQEMVQGLDHDEAMV
ncbi:hypothetical protein COCNU_scaffold002442G000020 [Cocos nucifera]|nr:hypothetical protein [Cocos nucifera]